MHGHLNVRFIVLFDTDYLNKLSTLSQIFPTISQTEVSLTTLLPTTQKILAFCTTNFTLLNTLYVRVRDHVKRIKS